MKHIWRNNRFLMSKQKNAVKSQKVIFQKWQNLVTEHLHERQLIQIIQKL